MHAVKSNPNIRQDVFIADMIYKLCLMKEPCWLPSGAAQKQSLALLAAAIGEALQGMQARSVKGCHLAQPDDDDAAKSIEMLGRGLKFVCGPEKKRSLDLENRYAVRKPPVVQNMKALFFDVFRGDRDDGGRF